MRWFPVLVLFKISVLVQSWSFVHPVKKIHEHSESITGDSRDDWETKGRMLYAKEILPTTSISPETISTTLDEIIEEDNQDISSTPLSLDLSKPQEVTTTFPECSTVESSETTLCPENLTASTVADTQERGEERNSQKVNYKNKIFVKKGNLSFRPVAHVEEKNITKKLKKDAKPIKKSMEYNEVKKSFNSQNSSIKKVVPKVHRLKRDISLKLSKENSDICSDVINQLCSALMTDTFKNRKTKRENELKNYKNGFTVEGFWETPMTHIIGNGIDDVKVQYARPLVSNLNLLNQSCYNENTDNYIDEPHQLKQINNTEISGDQINEDKLLDLEPSFKNLATKNSDFRRENLLRNTHKWDEQNRKVYSSMRTEQSLKKFGKLAGKLKPLWNIDEEEIDDVRTSSQGKKGKKYGLSHGYPYSGKSSKDKELDNIDSSDDKNVDDLHVIRDSQNETSLMQEHNEKLPSVLTKVDAIQPLKLPTQLQKERLNYSFSDWQNPRVELLELTNSQKPNLQGINFETRELQDSIMNTQTLEENDNSFDTSVNLPNQNWESLKSQNTSFANAQQNGETNSLNIPQNQIDGSTYETKVEPKLLTELTRNRVNNFEDKIWEPSSLRLTSKDPEVKLDLLNKQSQEVNKWKNLMVNQNQGKEVQWGQSIAEAPLFEDFNLMNQKNSFQNAPIKFSGNKNSITKEQVPFAEGLSIKSIKSPLKGPSIVVPNSNSNSLSDPELITPMINYDITKLHSKGSKEDSVASKTINIQNNNQEELEIQSMPLYPRPQNLVSKGAQFKNKPVNEPAKWGTKNKGTTLAGYSSLSPESISNLKKDKVKYNPMVYNLNKYQDFSKDIPSKEDLHVMYDDIYKTKLSSNENQLNMETVNYQDDNSIKPNSINNSMTLSMENQQIKDLNEHSLPLIKGLKDDLNLREIDQSKNEPNKLPDSLSNYKTPSISSINDVAMSERMTSVSDSNLKSQNFYNPHEGIVKNILDSGNNPLYQPSQNEYVDWSVLTKNVKFPFAPNLINNQQVVGYPDMKEVVSMKHFNDQPIKYKDTNETGDAVNLGLQRSNSINFNIPSKRSKTQPSVITDAIVTDLSKTPLIVESNYNLNEFDNIQKFKSDEENLKLQRNVIKNNSITKNMLNPSLKELQQQWDTVNYVSNPITVESQLFSEQNSLDGEMESKQEEPSLQNLDRDFVNIDSEKHSNETKTLLKETDGVEENTPIDSIKLSKLYPRTISIRKIKLPTKLFEKKIEGSEKPECPTNQIINRDWKQLTPITTPAESTLYEASCVNTELTNRSRQENNTDLNNTIIINNVKSEIKNLKNSTTMKNHKDDFIVNIEHGKSNTAQFEKDINENDETENDLKEIRLKSHLKKNKLKTTHSLSEEADDSATNDSDLSDETNDNERPLSYKSQSHRLSKHRRLKNKIQSKCKSSLIDQDSKKINQRQGKNNGNLGFKKRRTVPPINITIAMKNLFNRINPEEVTVSNSSSLGLDGSLKFSIELKDKNTQSAKSNNGGK